MHAYEPWDVSWGVRVAVPVPDSRRKVGTVVVVDERDRTGSRHGGTLTFFSKGLTRLLNAIFILVRRNYANEKRKSMS